MIKVCLVGASGRMGHEIAKAIADDNGVELSGAADRQAAEGIITDITVAAASADVIIDFTSAEGTMANLPSYKKLKKPLVIGSTGLADAQWAQLKPLADDMPLMWASNMSVGINVMAKLVELAAKVLGDQFDIEVFEAHHRYKKDAPSGTAITLAEAASRGRGLNLKDAAVYSREGITGERDKNSIGFQVLRGGDIAGDHTVFFCGDGERIEITHRASNRQTFAKGAVRAAKWLIGKKAGLYTINDVLGL